MPAFWIPDPASGLRIMASPDPPLSEDGPPAAEHSDGSHSSYANSSWSSRARAFQGPNVSWLKVGNFGARLSSIRARLPGFIHPASVIPAMLVVPDLCPRAPA